MSKELIKEDVKEESQDLVYQAVVEDKKSISFVWILPLIILGILSWIAYESYMKKGTNITVVFKSAEGLKEGVTPLEYKGLQLGKVTKIDMHEDLKNVKVNILINSDVASYVANEASEFWIKKPTISLTKITSIVESQAVGAAEIIAVDVAFVLRFGSLFIAGQHQNIPFK